MEQILESSELRGGAAVRPGLDRPQQHKERNRRFQAGKTSNSARLIALLSAVVFLQARISVTTLQQTSLCPGCC